MKDGVLQAKVRSASSVCVLFLLCSCSVLGSVHALCYRFALLYVVCLIVVFVCLLSELHVLRELIYVALACIDHVIVIWSEFCGPVAWDE